MIYTVHLNSPIEVDVTGQGHLLPKGKKDGFLKYFSYDR